MIAPLPATALDSRVPSLRRIDKTPTFKFDSSAGSAMLQSAIFKRELEKQGTQNDLVDFVSALSTQVVRTQIAMQAVKIYATSAKAANDAMQDIEAPGLGNDTSLFRDRATGIAADQSVAEAPQPAQWPGVAAKPGQVADAYAAAGTPATPAARIDLYA